jgi:hypothetical protein
MKGMTTKNPKRRAAAVAAKAQCMRKPNARRIKEAETTIIGAIKSSKCCPE